MTDKPDTSPEALRAHSDARSVLSYTDWADYAEAYLRALADEKAAWTAREADLKHQLRNLLAIIFRDGGQRAAAYPTLAEAVEAAHLEWAELVRERDEAKQAFLVIENDLHNINFKVLPNVRERAEQAEAGAAAAREALASIYDCTNGIMPIYNDASDLMQKCIAGNDARWTRLFAIWAEAKAALSSTAGADQLKRMERMRAGLKRASELLHGGREGHFGFFSGRVLQVSNEEIAEIDATLADQPGEKP